MQIVIDVPDGCYDELCNAQFPIQDAYRLVAWIKNGTPLPKGHGRLIDGDRLDKERIDYIVDGYADNPNDCAEFGAMIIKAPTIIPAEEVSE